MVAIYHDTATGDLENSPYYHKFLNALLRLLAADENLLEDRGAFIIRCFLLPCFLFIKLFLPFDALCVK